MLSKGSLSFYYPVTFVHTIHISIAKDIFDILRILQKNVMIILKIVKTPFH